MHQLGQRLGEAVAQRLRHDGRIIVMSRPELGGKLVDAMAGRHGETAQVVDATAFLRRHEIGE